MNALKRHLSIILSIFIIFTMCPSTLYASSIDTDGTAPEITEPEPDAAQGKAIPDESESITEEIFDEAAYVTAEETVDETEDEAAPVIEEMIPETSESPDMDDDAVRRPGCPGCCGSYQHLASSSSRYSSGRNQVHSCHRSKADALRRHGI